MSFAQSMAMLCDSLCRPWKFSVPESALTCRTGRLFALTRSANSRCEWKETIWSSGSDYDHPSAWLMLHGCDVINRVVQSFDPRINFPTAVARPRLYRDVASCHNGATNIGARLRKSGDGVCPARLPGQMKTFQVVTELQFVECRSNDTDFEQGSSLFAVVTHRTKRPQTSDGDVGSAIDARPALYVPLHPAGCHKGGVSIEAGQRFGVSYITVDKNHSFILRAASRRYPIAYAIAGSINSHPDRVPQGLALRFIDGNAATKAPRPIHPCIFPSRSRLRHLLF